MKKVIATLIALCLVLSMSVCAFAEGKATIGITGIGEVTAVPAGNLFFVTFGIENLEALADVADNDGSVGAFQLRIDYDTTKITLVKDSAVGLLENVSTNALGQEVKTPWDTAAADIEGALDGDIQGAKILVFNSDTKTKLGKELKGDLDFIQVPFFIADGGEYVTTDIEITVESVTDSAQGTTGKAVSYVDAIEVGNQTIAIKEEIVEPESKPEEKPESKPEEKPESTESKEDVKPGTSTTAPSTSKPATTKPGTTSPSTGDAGVLAVGALMVVAAGAAFVTMKKR